jgi:hypothetical protein
MNISLTSINWLVFVVEIQCVLQEVWTKYLNTSIMRMDFGRQTINFW